MKAKATFCAPSLAEMSAPRTNAARVSGSIARCWASYFGCYGIEPTHVFLGPDEWEAFELWMEGQVMVRTAEEAGDPRFPKYVFRGMHVYKTDRPGVTCAVCFHDPQSDTEPSAKPPKRL